MRGSPGLPTPAVATFGPHSMSTPQTTNGRGSDGAQGPAAGVAPPHSIEAEQSVLGAMLLSDRTHYAFVIEEGLKVEDFYRERHREVYESMLALFTAGDSIDVLTVTEHLRSRGRLDAAGGQAEIDALTAAVPSVGNLRQYAQIVRDRALLRRLLAASYEIQASVHGHDAPPREIVEWAERAVLEVAHDDRQKDFRRVGEVLHAEVRKWQELSAEGRSLTGTPSGFADLDSITGGFQPGNLIIIAARPAMGKSSLVTNIAENVALNKDRRRPVALFSLEMSEAELAQRFVASQASIKGDDLRKGRLRDEAKWKRVLRTAAEYEAAPLYIDDSSDVGILDVRAKARRLHQQAQAEYGGLGLVIVDYLQLMRADTRLESRVLQVGEMSRGLKILARELNVPVIALSQLSRAVEQRSTTDKKPQLSDLRESGCLAGDTLVYLPETGERRPIAELEGAAPFGVRAVNTETWRSETAQATHAFATGTKPVFELRTQLGRRIRATANHRFLTFDGWCRLDQLEAGAYVAVPRELPSPQTSILTPSELALLGHLIGDGSTLPRHAIQFTSREETLARGVARLATEVFGSRIAPRVRAERSWFQTYLASTEPLTHRRRNPVAEWLDRFGCFGLRSYEKRVPDAVFASRSSDIATFLRHLWSSDGCVWTSEDRLSSRIYYPTSSQVLARDVQHLLLRLGITARVGTHQQNGRGRDQFHVVVSGRDDSLRFVQQIGGLAPPHARHASRLRARLSQAAAITNRDVIPRAAWQRHVIPAMAATGMTTRQLQSALGVAYNGTAMYGSNLGRHRASRIATLVASPELGALAAADIYWDRIASISSSGVEPVYDLTVERHHNFVADDFVVHNSIEQDADLVMFIYRDEYYFPETTDKPGEAELIIAKHRNGGLGDVPLTFQNEYPRFLGLQRTA
jgi:replicative DNA helicase